MPLPTTFGSTTNPTGQELDAQFAALALTGINQCTIVGTNALTLTPVPNNPTVASYIQGQLFGGIAAVTNTGAVTAQVGSLPALSVYVDTADGPEALFGGEIVAKNYILLAYDAALNSGSGGFHLVSPTRQFVANGSVATAMSSVGPTGSHTAVQEWLVVLGETGVKRYIPCF